MNKGPCIFKVIQIALLAKTLAILLLSFEIICVKNSYCPRTQFDCIYYSLTSEGRDAGITTVLVKALEKNGHK